jgi:hypothetical protein
MKRIILAFCLVAAAIATPAVAGTRDHRSAHVTFWLPDNWTVEGEEANQLTASDPKGEVALMFMLNDRKDMKAAITALDDVIAKVATDVKMGAPQKVDINGMEASVVDATGKADGKRVELSVMIVKAPRGKFLLVFGMLESRVKKTHEAVLTKILTSLKPAKT